MNNLHEGNKKRVLIIKDSFANCVAPFVALEIEYTDVLDMRIFTGSTKTYIAQIRPDIVVVLYNPASICEVELSEHTSELDFN